MRNCALVGYAASSDDSSPTLRDNQSVSSTNIKIFFTLQNGNGRLFRNVRKQLPLLTLLVIPHRLLRKKLTVLYTKIKILFTLDDGTGRMSRNVRKQLPLLTLLVIPHRRLRTNYRFYIQRSRFFLPLKMEPVGCPETSVSNYHYSLYW